MVSNLRKYMYRRLTELININCGINIYKNVYLAGHASIKVRYHKNVNRVICVQLFVYVSKCYLLS